LVSFFGQFLWSVSLVSFFGQFLWSVSLVSFFGQFLWSVSLVSFFGQLLGYFHRSTHWSNPVPVVFQPNVHIHKTA
jgi:hypothetical protein